MTARRQFRRLAVLAAGAAALVAAVYALTPTPPETDTGPNPGRATGKRFDPAVVEGSKPGRVFLPDGREMTTEGYAPPTPKP